jgi:hypothetical protein
LLSIPKHPTGLLLTLVVSRLRNVVAGFPVLVPLAPAALLDLTLAGRPRGRVLFRRLSQAGLPARAPKKDSFLSFRFDFRSDSRGSTS